MSVSAFSMEVLIGDTNFTSPTGATRRSSRSCSAKGVPSFLSYFKTLSIAPVSGIEPATSCSVVNCSTDWTNPYKVINSLSWDPFTWVGTKFFKKEKTRHSLTRDPRICVSIWTANRTAICDRICTVPCERVVEGKNSSLQKFVGSI